jgi:hypothetical protein
MEAEPVQGFSASIYTEPKDPFRSADGDAAIQTCYELLSSGRPLSEVLDAAKRLSSLNQASKSTPGGGPGDTQIPDIAGEARSASSRLVTAQVTEPVELRLVDHSLDSSGALAAGIGADAPHSRVDLNVRQSLGSARIEKGWVIKLSRLIGAFLFWLIPAISLIVVGTIGKSLIDSDQIRKPAEATGEAMPGAIQLGQDLTAPTTAEAENIAPRPPTSQVARTAPQIRPEQIESPRAAEQVVNGSPAEPATEAGTTAQAGIPDRGSLSVRTGKRTRPAALGSPVVTSRPKPAYGHHARIQRPTNGPMCPHSGHCLTPP